MNLFLLKICETQMGFKNAFHNLKFDWIEDEAFSEIVFISSIY